jgi:hypothetical protein
VDAFIKLDKLINPEGYDINSMLLDLLQSKMFAGDDTEDPYGHVEYFEDVCANFNLISLPKMRLSLNSLDKPLLLNPNLV